MPHTSQPWPLQPPAGSVHGNTTLKLTRARTAGNITQAEYRQYRDWYIGLIMLNSQTPPEVGQTDNFITRRLWAGLWIPLGIELHKEET